MDNKGGGGDVEPGIISEVYKVIVIGDMGVGKTSLIRRIVHEFYSERYKSTIGVDFSCKDITSNGRIARIQFWDIGGQDRFRGLTHVYYKDAVGALVVYDVHRCGTAEGAAEWFKDLKDKMAETPIPVVLLGNKIDQPNWPPDIEEQVLKIINADREIEESKHCDPWLIQHLKVSAKENTAVDNAVQILVKEMQKRSKAKKEKRDVDLITLNEDGTSSSLGNGSSCCK